MRRLLFIVGCVLAARSAEAVSTYKGLQPGKSTRTDVEATLGRPLRVVNATTVEYGAGDGGSIVVEFRTGNIVDRIERRYGRPVARAALVGSLGLPDEPEEKRTDRDGKLVEYFGGVKSLALTYAAAEPGSGVQSVGYYSME